MSPRATFLGASHRDDDFLSRDGASGKFSVMDLWFMRYQTLSNAWSVKMAAAGQIASDPVFTHSNSTLEVRRSGEAMAVPRSAETMASPIRSNCVSIKSRISGTDGGYAV